MKAKLFLLCASSALVLACGAATRAIDLSVEQQRAAQPRFVQPSYACGVVEGDWADGRWAYRFHVTQAWNGSLPQWPSVNLKPAVTDWTPYDRFVVDVFNDAIGGDVLCGFLSQPDGRLQNGLSPRSQPLADYGYHRWVIDLKDWPKETNPARIGRVHFFFTTPSSADIYLAGFHLLRPGEALPPVSETFLAQKVRPARIRAENLRKARRAATLANFRAKCEAAGQRGAHAWIGKATSMEKVRPRDDFDIAAADRFTLRLARGEYESLQVFVMPNGRDLAQVTVEPNVPGIDPKAFHTSVVGYVKTVNPPPYKGPRNVATNLPGGYLRTTASLPTGWWPDPILDWLGAVDVKGDDLQGFWVRLKCPENQKAGTYSGTLTVKGAGWQEVFPFSVRVYDFAVPKKTPLPLAITFGPGPHTQFATKEDTALAEKLRKDPLAPINAWRAHETEWGDFLADYYLTMDSLYHGGYGTIHWDVLLRLRDQGRLGLFNFGYWSYPADMKPETLAAWLKNMHRRFDPVYLKAKELGLLDHAYLYGCDEISPKYFPNIAWALAELKKAYPEVPRFTTAYDHDFGVNGSKLDQMDWFTPTTVKYAENYAKVAPSRAAGHQVWWYIACGPHAPYANLFVEYSGIEARQLMGAQTVKWRPEGFLYYQVSIWNARRPISGTSAFTDWEPRSWTRYHGDGSWFCCGPEGRPCATIRMENFRDGLEDLAYAQEYEHRTGKTCAVPVEVCRDINQFSDDPQVYYAWRDGIAEAIEKASPAVVADAGALVLAERGKPAAYTIVRAEKASASEIYAAEELRDFLARATGVTLPIATDAAPVPAQAILIGSAAGAEPALGEDGFRLKRDGRRLRIVGSPKRGALYGVYEFLERFAGCRWYASWHTVVPSKDRVTVPPALDEAQVPAFAMREPFWYDVLGNGAFAARNKVNSRSWRGNEEKYGGTPFRFGGGLGSCHTFETLMPVKEFFDAHPEYFSEIKGTRRNGRTQLCLTNPDVLRIVTERVLARIRKDPGAKFYGVSQNDWYNYCECPKCKAIDDEEESHAGTMIRFVNAVAERVEKEFPDAIIETLAYQYTRKPPKKTKLRHNVVPCLCTIECDFAHPLDASAFRENVKFRSDIEGWAKQTDQLYVWDYTTDFPNYTLPFANVLTLQGNLRFFRANKVREIFEQGAYQGRHGDFAELKAWLIAKWAWNPDLPAEPLLEDFFGGYYGKGAPFVRAYFDELHALQRAYSTPAEKPLIIWVGPENPAIPDAFLEKAAGLWAQAIAATKDDPATSYNVRMGAFGVDYMRLERLRRKGDKALWLSSKPVDHSRLGECQRLAKFLLDRMAEAKDIRLAESAERHADLQKAWRRLLEKKGSAFTPGATRGELQESYITCGQLGTWGSFVDDPKASDGRALKLHNTHFEWCATMHASRVEFEPGAKYTVRVRARCEKAGEGEAFWAGVYDPMAKKGRGGIQPKTSEVGPDYAWYDVCTWVPNENEYVWFGPGRFNKDGKSAIQGVWIDKIEFVKAQ